MAANQKNKRKTSRSRQKGSRRVPALLLLLGGIVLAGAAIVWLLAGEKGAAVQVPLEVRGQPSLKVDREQVDFGDVAFNEMVTASFTLANVGDQPLRFLKQPYIEVAAGC